MRSAICTCLPVYGGPRRSHWSWDRSRHKLGLRPLEAARCAAPTVRGDADASARQRRSDHRRVPGRAADRVRDHRRRGADRASASGSSTTPRSWSARSAAGSNCEATAGNPDAPDAHRSASSPPPTSRSRPRSRCSCSSSRAASPASTACPPTARRYVTLKANAGAGLEFSTPGVEAGSDEVQRLLAQGRVQRHRQGRVRAHLEVRLRGRRRRVHRQRRRQGQGQARLDPELPPERRRLRPARPGLRHDLRRHLGHRLGLGGRRRRVRHRGGGVEAGVGAKYFANGDTTYFFKAKANVNAAAGNSFAGGFGANGDGEIIDRHHVRQGRATRRP